MIASLMLLLLWGSVIAFLGGCLALLFIIVMQTVSISYEGPMRTAGIIATIGGAVLLALIGTYLQWGWYIKTIVLISIAALTVLASQAIHHAPAIEDDDDDPEPQIAGGAQ